MNYEKELLFAEKFLRNFGLNISYVTKTSLKEEDKEHVFGLQDILNYKYNAEDTFQLLKNNCEANIIYQFENILMCSYLVFELPQMKEPTYAYIGPYTKRHITRQEILSLAEKFHVAPGNLTQLEQFYMDLPLLTDDNMLFTLLYTLGEYIWGDANHFTIQEDFHIPFYSSESVTPVPDIQSPEDAQLSIQILEKRYETELNLIKAVTNGQVHKAELFFSNMTSRQFEQRTSNPVRDLKNYGIVLNTLLRKAVESAAVHPIHIDAISSQYARKIEAATSEASCISLYKEMVRKYCLLVKNHSLKGYSLLVRKVITKIDYDLTADLSLKVQAECLNVNPSYLSTLFKKETGMTLTEYINRKRIENALLLLNSTDMQIQMIAQYCGITDVNYFTKTFKKIVGKTPKEYRELINVHF